MIVSDRVLDKVTVHLRSVKHPFRSKWANEVAAYCFEFNQKFQKAPRAAVQAWFLDYARKTKNDANIDLMEQFLQGLSEEYRQEERDLNEDFVIDRAAKYFNEVKLERLRQAIDNGLENGDVDLALEQVSSFHKLEMATDDTVDVLTDEEAMADALDNEQADVMVEYPGALGEFFGDQLARDNFVAFLAPEKRGKSYWLMDLAWRSATIERRRTKFYSVGDMTLRQMLRRFAVRAAGRPLDSGEFRYPLELRAGPDGKTIVERDLVHYEERMKTSCALDKLYERWKKTSHKASLLRMKCVANSTMSMADIDADMQEEARNGFPIDVAVVDYMDILAPEPGTGKDDARHRINENWKAGRRLSQKHHCLLLSATQSDAASYDAKRMSRKNFSEDKRKIAHVTGMAGINQMDEEKQQGVFRINWVALREAHYIESREVTVAGLLAIANPAIRSAWL